MPVDGIPRPLDTFVVQRYPSYVWMGMVPCWIVSVGLVWMIELGVRLVHLYLPVCYVGLMAGCLCMGALVVPQQCCLYIPRGVLAFLFLTLLAYLQYSTAVAFMTLPRGLVLALYGLPNLIASLYIVSVLVLFTGSTLLSTASVRTLCWRFYTVYAPLLLIPQLLIVLTGCLTSSGSQACIHHCFLP